MPVTLVWILKDCITKSENCMCIEIFATLRETSLAHRSIVIHNQKISSDGSEYKRLSMRKCCNLAEIILKNLDDSPLLSCLRDNSRQPGKFTHNVTVVGCSLCFYPLTV